MHSFPLKEIGEQEELKRSRFYEGLLPGELQQRLLRMPPTTSWDLKTMVLRFMAAYKLSSPSGALHPVLTSIKEAGVPRRLSAQSVYVVKYLPARRSL